MFRLFKKQEPVVLTAPVDGEMISLEEVPDKVFAAKIMGDGVAFRFDGDTIYSPCDAKVIMIADTVHAIGLKCRNGAEVLIHIGLDTVELNGKGFEKLVDEGEQVSKGIPLIKIDRSIMQAAAIDLTTPMVITDSSDNQFHIEEKNLNQNVFMGKTELIRFD